MAKTFEQMVNEARAGIGHISPHDAYNTMQTDPATLLIDVRDAAHIAQTGSPQGAIAISAGMLPVRADLEMPEAMRNAHLQDRDRPIIVTCGVGMIAALAAKSLVDMGFSNVRILEGGSEGWQKAGLPLE